MPPPAGEHPFLPCTGFGWQRHSFRYRPCCRRRPLYPCCCSWFRRSRPGGQP
ncbi:hypothetical protein [Synechococcus sp. ATX 2A4]|uniref:hypothetical protein n=1 Tax=Synechococcus sp. ATX 2A4 TaxID=2823727 RepID=UPI0020CB9CF2|nr:hypothetical protein [Synechococcus sp. ATX 2A4]